MLARQNKMGPALNVKIALISNRWMMRSHVHDKISSLLFLVFFWSTFDLQNRVREFASRRISSNQQALKYAPQVFWAS